MGIQPPPLQHQIDRLRSAYNDVRQAVVCARLRLSARHAARPCRLCYGA